MKIVPAGKEKKRGRGRRGLAGHFLCVFLRHMVRAAEGINFDFARFSTQKWMSLHLAAERSATHGRRTIFRPTIARPH
jgi:hypothetical protein